MILNLFAQTGGVLQDGQNEPQHVKFRHFVNGDMFLQEQNT